MISKWIKRILLLATLGIFLSSAISARADTCDNIPSDQANISKKIECLTNVTNQLAAQSKTLSNQIAQFDYQIKLTTLKISQTEEQIKLLGGRIDQLETSLGDLSNAFSERAVATYKMYRSDEPVFLLFGANNIGDMISSFHYLAKIQESDRNLMLRLQKAQNVYVDQKSQQETLAKQLDDQKKELNTQKVAKANLLADTQNSEAKYQQLLVQAIAQRNAFRSFISSQGGASILNNQTVYDSSWPGYYYNQRDSDWGNHALGISTLSMADYGCLVTSVSMLASHYGRNIKPIDIANTPSAFDSPTSDTANLKWTFSVNGVNVNLHSQYSGYAISTSLLDQYVSSGPVIVGLYTYPYPEHYIVIKSGSGGNYKMLDPFLENGGSDGNQNFSNKYSVSNITRLFTVNFN